MTTLNVAPSSNSLRNRFVSRQSKSSLLTEVQPAICATNPSSDLVSRLEILWPPGRILVKRGSESKIDRGNVAAKCNKQARQAPQRMRRRIARVLCHRASGERDGHVIVLVFVQHARQAHGLPGDLFTPASIVKDQVDASLLALSDVQLGVSPCSAIAARFE
jgi:hypothetical protein